MEEYEQLNDRQKEQAKELAELAVEFGMFDQSSGADGAHYAPAAKNPFKGDGLVCKNCVFFDEINNQCQIVSGPIEPDAICKLWVIPESLVKSENGLKDELKKLLAETSSNGKAERQARIDAIMEELSGD